MRKIRRLLVFVLVVLFLFVNNVDAFAAARIIQTQIQSPFLTSTDGRVSDTVYFLMNAAIKYNLEMIGAWKNYTIPFTYTQNVDRLPPKPPIISPSTIFTSKIVLGYTVNSSSYTSMVNNTKVINEIVTATYGVNGLGTLSGTAPTNLIEYANNNCINSNLMISNNFDAVIAKQLLESSTNRKNLKNNILNLLKTNNYNGVNIDIENIPASCRDQFTALIIEIYSELKPLGYTVSVAVQAKVYDSPNTTCNYAFDYKTLAMYSDYLMIMAYDEHYIGGTPGAIASIKWTTAVLNYTLSVVPKEKIVLGIAAYGYDWTSTTTKAYSMIKCIDIANQYGATIYMDNLTKSKYFNYMDSYGINHTVWFEDGDTIAFKLDLVNTADIRGIGIWRLGLENTAYWNTIKSKLSK